MNPQAFNALGEQNRLNITELLRQGPRSVNEISHILKINQPKTSKHLRILADAGVVEVTPLAQKRIYKINTKSMQELEDWAAKMTKVWNDRFDRLEKVLAKEKDDKKSKRRL